LGAAGTRPIISPVRIALFHGYELTGSGSNEYTRYLAAALHNAGHEVHLLCREPKPADIAGVAVAHDWDLHGRSQQMFQHRGDGLTVHRLPHAPIRPVYLTDKQRRGNVKSFAALSDAELREYHEISVRAVTAVLRKHPVDVLHANHVLYQPMVARDACAATDTPYVVFPHGSAIEYTLRQDERYREPALQALLSAHAIISGSEEVKQRILDLYPDNAATLAARTEIVGVGVDTTLFAPVARAERDRAIAPLLQGGPYRGKSPLLARDLQGKLHRGVVEAVREYRDAYDHSQPDEDLATKLSSISWDDPLLLFVGALTAGKGLQSLIAALPEIGRTHPGVSLAIVGSGAYRETLEALVHAIATGNERLLDNLVEAGWDLDHSEETGPWKDVASYLADSRNRQLLLSAGAGFRDRVLFLGRLDHARLQHLFPCADIAVFPSLIPEAYPLVLMEALANGVIPAVSDFSGFHDGLETLEPLLGAHWVDRMRLPVADEGRIAGIANGIGQILTDPERPAFLPRLREVAVKHFDWSVRAKQMADAYASAIAVRRC